MAITQITLKMIDNFQYLDKTEFIV